jgi:ubiquinone/menaquinone biosynthesis C-methylase UbiE
LSEPSPSDIEAGLEPGEAGRVYDRIGRSLALGGPFEGRARGLAQSWLEVEPGQRALEVGVGLGSTLEILQGRIGEGQLVGVDVSQRLMSLAAARAPRAHLVRGSVSALPCRDACFDWVVVAYTLDLLPSSLISVALRELRRVLRPQGRLVLCSLSEGQTWLESCLMATWKRIHRTLGPSVVGGCRPLELAPLLPGAGLELLRRQHVGQLGTPSEVILAGRAD